MKNENTFIALDCKHYIGDRPCEWHKHEGAMCKCKYYKKVIGQIVIIKLDAIGDVLRTTCLLPGIEKKWSGYKINWITRPESIPLLENNPYVDQIVPLGIEAILLLSTTHLNFVINLDASKISSELAAMASAEQKVGYVMDKKGYVVAANKEAEDWLKLGVFDNLKKANEDTYQNIMADIVGLDKSLLKYVLNLTDDETQKGVNGIKDNGIDVNKTIIGIHTGGGGRWRLKQWYENSFCELIERLLKKHGNEIQILLLGGPLEKEQNNRIMSQFAGRIFDAGCNNTIREFASIIRNCNIVLSGDTLAMHIALAMSCRVVVLFGPTSSSEIELFGLGEKVIPDLNCLVCYKRDCDFDPNCMESISVDMVQDAIERQMSLAVQRKG